MIWLICITWLSTKGGVALPGFRLIGADKLAHAAAYGLLAWLVLWAFPQDKLSGLFKVWLFAAGYGAAMEWVQYRFFPNRFFEFDDMLANAIGAFLALVVVQVLKISRKR